MNKVWKMTTLVVAAAVLVACEPEVGSDKWCEKMVETPKGDWSTNDAEAFAEHCIFKTYEDKDD